MQRIVIDELDSAGVLVDCAHDVATAIAATELVEMRPEVGGGFRALPGRNVGAVRVGDLQLEVQPKSKVGVSQVLFLLGYARDPGFRPDDVAASPDSDLLPALAESVARQARRALAQGVHRGYVTVDEASRTVRGRIRLGDQITRHPGIPFPVEVTYDDYTHNVAENQILRTALRRLAAVPMLALETRLELQALDAWLDGVDVIARGTPLPVWNRTRLNARYHAALALAEIVLKHESARTAGGDLEIASFVAPMWKVYEDFVARAIAESMSKFPGTTREQYPTTLDERQGGVRPVAMEVDIVHVVGGEPVIIADAKYKAASPGGTYPNADQYQMLAYCTALGLSRAWLVYAEGRDVPVVRTVRNAGVEIVEWPLDLSVAPREILAQVDELADAMWASTGLIAQNTAAMSLN